VRKQRVERGAIQIFPLNDYGANCLRIANIFERIRIKQDQIGGLSVGDSAEIISAASSLCRSNSGITNGDPPASVPPKIETPSR
jgi:hypothetical protein